MGFSPEMDDFYAGLKPFCVAWLGCSALKGGVIIFEAMF